jgi:hypothetical protein
MTLEIQPVTNRKELEFPIMLCKMTDEETKEYHLKRLKELSDKSLGEIPQLDEPTEEQSKWMHFRLSRANRWSNVDENKNGDWKY